MPTNTIATIHPKSSSDQYDIVSGITRENSIKLVSYASEDEDVKKHTSDFINIDGTPGRFSSLEAYTTWQNKGRFIYSLLNEKKAFCGIVWFSHESQIFAGKTYDFTFGIRLYGPARGIGLAKPFSQATLTHFQDSSEYRKSSSQGIWLRTDEDNMPAISTYRSLGYVPVKSSNQAHKITMVLQ